MTLTQQQLDTIIGSSGPLLDVNIREVFQHLLRRIEDLENEVNKLTENRADKARLRELLDDHAAHHSSKRNGAERVIPEEKPLVELLRQLIEVLPD